MPKIGCALALGLVLAGCSNDPAPTADKPASAATALNTASTASPTPSATAAAPATPAPSASASASAAALVPAEAPADAAPSEEEFAKLDKEIAVRASGEQKCTTKVLRGWFEMVCGQDEKLVRATKVDVLTGFDPKKTSFEGTKDDDGKGTTLRWVAALPATGEACQARFWGKGLHEIFLTLEHTDKGWKGQLTGKKPD